MNKYFYFIIFRSTHTFCQCGTVTAPCEGDAFCNLHEKFPQYHLEETGCNPQYLCWIRSTSEFVDI